MNPGHTAPLAVDGSKSGELNTSVQAVGVSTTQLFASIAQSRRNPDKSVLSRQTAARYIPSATLHPRNNNFADFAGGMLEAIFHSMSHGGRDQTVGNDMVEMDDQIDGGWDPQTLLLIGRFIQGREEQVARGWEQALLKMTGR